MGGLGLRSSEQITASRARTCRSTNELRADTFLAVLSTTVLEIICAGSHVSD